MHPYIMDTTSFFMTDNFSCAILPALGLIAITIPQSRCGVENLSLSRKTRGSGRRQDLSKEVVSTTSTSKQKMKNVEPLCF